MNLVMRKMIFWGIYVQYRTRLVIVTAHSYNFIIYRYIVYCSIVHSFCKACKRTLAGLGGSVGCASDCHTLIRRLRVRTPPGRLQSFVEIWFWLCWGLTTCQPLWIILCRLSEKGRWEIEETVEEMNERDRRESGKWMKVKKQKKYKHIPSTLTCCMDSMHICIFICNYHTSYVPGSSLLIWLYC